MHSATYVYDQFINTRGKKFSMTASGEMCEAYKAYFAVPIWDQDNFLLETLNYNKCGWEVIGDFKMVAFLMRLQGGFTKNPCFILFFFFFCLWASRDKATNFQKKYWPPRTYTTVAAQNIKHEPSVNP